MDGNGSGNLKLASINSTCRSPYERARKEPELAPNAGGDCRKFEVSCDAGVAGHLEVVSESISVRIGQRVRGQGTELFWSGLLVECREREDGSLAVEVVIYHPDWDEPLKIASIQSDPFGASAQQPSIRCDLQQKQI
jgi:hypothetical protein